MRRWIGLLTVILSAAVFGGCARAPQSKIVTLRLVLWGTPKDEASINDSLERFYKTHPNIRVKLEITPHARVFDKLLISFAGGRAPDVSRVSSLWFYPLAAKGVLEDLDPFITQDKTFDLPDFYDVALDGWGRYSGRVYALPTDLDLYGLYYNKKMFDKAHIPYPDASWDWDKYLQVARRLTKDTDGDGQIDQWGSTVDGFWQAYVWQNGGEILNASNTKCTLDEPSAYDALQWMTDLRQKWHVAPSPADTADVGQLGLWVMGRLGMFHSGSWAAAMMFKDRVTTFDWDVAPFTQRQEAGQLSGRIGVCYDFGLQAQTGILGACEISDWPLYAGALGCGKSDHPEPQVHRRIRGVSESARPTVTPQGLCGCDQLRAHAPEYLLYARDERHHNELHFPGDSWQDGCKERLSRSDAHGERPPPVRPQAHCGGAFHTCARGCRRCDKQGRRIRQIAALSRFRAPQVAQPA
ncbi:MAG: sugar ABC transporter substrate-binding protein [Armatimonadetes bacterium]|nr:sugar ABC transporter substrate-binding protein [Armatimonadota bacterium]